MKKIISLLAAFLIVFSTSICAFAIQSPGGEVKPDQFNIVGTVTKSNEKLADIVVEIGDKKATTDKKGSYRIEGVEVGNHTITFKAEDKEIGKLSINISKDSTTKFEKLPDGRYNIGIASNIATVNISFNIKEDGTVEITNVSPAGSDSPTSPPSGDMMSSIAMFVLIVSFAGIMISAFFRKKYSC